MSRRLLLFLLVPALVGTMVGVGVADFRVPFMGDDAEIDAAGETPVAVAPPAFDPSVAVEPEPLGSLDADVDWAALAEEREAAAAATPSPDPSASPSPSPGADDSGADPDAGYDVAAVQQQLTDLRYYGGAVDGEDGAATRAAVMAFQKVHGLSADGAVGPATLGALAAPQQPSLRGGAANRIEVDLTRQVLYFVEGGQLQRIMPVSSGSGDSYETSGGGSARSLTPTGTYRIERRIRGVREADLGTLYDPLYFYRGWAIHGSNSVPAYPASHGCVRVTRADAIWLFDRAPNGTQVLLYGGSHTFSAGSGAAGTDQPAGDTPQDSAPAPATSPAPASSSAPAPEPSAEPPPEQPATQPAPTPPPATPPVQDPAAEDPPSSTTSSEPPSADPPADDAPTPPANPSESPASE